MKTIDKITDEICGIVADDSRFRSDIKRIITENFPVWRDALKELPPIGEAVILYSANKYGVRQGTHDGDAGWHDIFGNTAGNVTHWQPLPVEPAY